MKTKAKPSGNIFGLSPQTLGILGAGLGGILGATGGKGQTSGTQGYTGGIPDYTATRTLVPGAFDSTGRRPGEAGRRYFTDVDFTRGPDNAILGGAEIAAMNQAALEQQQAYEAAGQELLGLAAQPAAQPADTTTATLTDTLGQENIANLISNITGMFGGGAGATSTAVDAVDAVDVLTDSTTDTTTDKTTDKTTDTTTDTATDTAANAFANFLAPFYNSELTPAQLIQLGDSGYDLAEIAGGLSVDVNALTNAIAQARSAAQTQSIFDAVDPSDGFSDTEAASIANLILEGRTGIGNVAEQYGLDDMDVIAGLFKGGYEAPAEIIERIAANNPGLTEVQLMENLLAQGRATPEEIAAYYSDNAAYPQYAGITAADIRAYAKERGIEGFAAGGMASLDGMGQGYYLGGPTDGMADLVPATIDGAQPAALSDGEFVVPADVVSHLGNGNSDAGAKQLYSMMDRVRTERTGTTKQGPEINPTKMMPA